MAANKQQKTDRLSESREVEIVKPWSIYRVGQRITPPGVLRQYLIEHNLAVPVQPETAPKARRSAKMMDAARELFGGNGIVTK